MGEFWPQNGLVALYHFNDGANLIDSSGNGYNLTNGGSVTFSQCSYGHGAIMNGDELDIASNFGISPKTEAFTIVMNYCVTTQPSDDGWELFYLEDATNLGLTNMIYDDDEGTKSLRISHCGPSTLAVNYSLTTNLWYKIYAIFGSGGTISLYVNGILLGTGSRGSTYTAFTDQFFIGDYTLGNVDEVAIFDYEWSANQVKMWQAYCDGKLV